MSPGFTKVLLAYINAVDKYAELCKLTEDLPSLHLDTLMKAEGLVVIGKAMRKVMEKENENG